MAFQYVVPGQAIHCLSGVYKGDNAGQMQESYP